MLKCMAPPWAGADGMVPGSGSVLLLDSWWWMQLLMVWLCWPAACGGRVLLHMKSFVPVSNALALQETTMWLCHKGFLFPAADSLHQTVKCCVLKLPCVSCFCLLNFGELGLVEEEETLEQLPGLEQGS